MQNIYDKIMIEIEDLHSLKYKDDNTINEVWDEFLLTRMEKLIDKNILTSDGLKGLITSFVTRFNLQNVNQNSNEIIFQEDVLETIAKLFQDQLSNYTDLKIELVNALKQLETTPEIVDDYIKSFIKPNGNNCDLVLFCLDHNVNQGFKSYLDKNKTAPIDLKFLSLLSKNEIDFVKLSLLNGGEWQKTIFKSLEKIDLRNLNYLKENFTINFFTEPKVLNYLENNFKNNKYSLKDLREVSIFAEKNDLLELPIYSKISKHYERKEKETLMLDDNDFDFDYD